jgi:hypothetical protein
MRKTGNPFRSIHGRSALIALLLCALCAVAIISGAALAGNESPKKPAHAASGSSRAQALALLAQIKRDYKTNVAVKKKFARDAAKHKGVLTSDIAFTAAVDGPYLYVLHVLLKEDPEAGSEDTDFVSLRSRLIRTDRNTGVKTTLLDQKDSYPFVLSAQGGHVAFQAVKYKLRKKTVKLDSTIYTARGADPTLTNLDTTTLTVADEDRLCGGFKLLAGLSAAGEPLVDSIESTCRSEDDSFLANLELWQADGAHRKLGPVSFDDELGGGSTVLNGQRLVATDPFEGGLATRTLDDSELKGIWHAGARAADIAGDGTIALIGRPEYHGCTMCADTFEAGTSIPAESAKSGPNDLPAEIEIPAAPEPHQKYPFLLFPSGDAENPVLLASERNSIVGLKFCGTNLYALKAELNANHWPEINEDTLYDFFYSDGARARYDVLLYDTHGNLVRSLGKTKKLAIRSYGCNADRLVIAAGSFNSINATEVGP